MEANSAMTETSGTTNRILTAQARESLRGKWRRAIGTYVVFNLITAIPVGISFIPYAGGGIAGILSAIISGPMALGLAIFTLSLSRNQNAKTSQIFEGFRNFNTALTAIIAFLVIEIFVFLWFLLLVIPGIVAALAYSQTFYIVAENNSIKPLDAIRKSREMTHGFKWKLFRLYFRFVGWALLCILTAGIGFLWLFPYIGVIMAKFYDDIARK